MQRWAEAGVYGGVLGGHGEELGGEWGSTGCGHAVSLELHALWDVKIWAVLVNAVIFFDLAKVGLLLQPLPVVLRFP